MVRGVFMADGPSDLPLGDHLEGLCAERGVDLVLTRIDPFRANLTGRAVEDRLRFLLDEGAPFDLAFVHRDAEAEPPEKRRGEIEAAAAVTGVEAPVVPIIPVRMTEAWLLLDEEQIRHVAGRPKSKVRLDLPSPREAERLADPKSRLADALLQASCTTGRRQRDFKRAFGRHRGLLLQRLDRDGPITQLSAWQQLVADVEVSLEGLAG